MLRPFLLIGLLLLPSAAFAQAGGDACNDRVNREMATEHRLWRATLFGKKKAADAPLFDVRSAADGSTWIKVGEDEWRSHSAEYENVRWFDLQMDTMDEHGASLPIRGIFETKRRLTSEIIPYLLMNMRVFRCRVNDLCEIVRRSTVQDGTAPVPIGDIHVPGCRIRTEVPTFPECHLRSAPAADTLQSKSFAELNCRAAGDSLILREAELLKAAVEYDAGYRSLLQFAGNFDRFLQQFRWTLLGSIRESVGVIGLLNRIPCFIGACDESPPPPTP